MAIAAATALLLFPPLAHAQFKPTLLIDEDCQAYAISRDNRIVYAVPTFKRVKKYRAERDEIWTADLGGKKKRIVDPEKFMPFPPVTSYIVDSLTWSPDGKRIAMSFETQQAPAPGENPEAPLKGGRDIALLDDDGHEIKVEGTKARFIENGTEATWLSDDATVVYLTGGGPYQIVRVNPADGKTRTLFAGHTFDKVVWDAARNQAFAVGENLSISGKLVLVQLDLLHETVNEIARLDDFQGELTVSASGTMVGFFENGDTIEAWNLAHPQKPIFAQAGLGKFEWGREDNRVLLKRGPNEKTSDLVWVGLRDETFTPILHDLAFHDFQIAPDGKFIIVEDAGKRILKVFPLE